MNIKSENPISYSVHIQVPIMLTIASRMVNKLGACSSISFQQEKFLGLDFNTRRIVRHYVSLPHCLTLIVVRLESNKRDSINMQKYRLLMPTQTTTSAIMQPKIIARLFTTSNVRCNLLFHITLSMLGIFYLYQNCKCLCEPRYNYTYIYKVLVK